MDLNKITRKDFDHWTTLTSHWRDMDALRHLNHAAYLMYMETARVQFYESLGFDDERWEQDQSTILASMHVDYLEQASHPATLEVGQRISRVGKNSFDIFTGVFPAGEENLLVIATFTLVSFNYEMKRSIPVPEQIRERLRGLEQ